MSGHMHWRRRVVHALPALVVVAQLFASAPLGAQDGKLAKRAKRAAEVLAELVAIPDKAPPKALLSEATCIAVVPGVVQVGFGFGGRAGYGLASCRTSAGWSLPTFVGLKGGSFGLQIGGQAADIVLVFVNRDAGRLASSTFDLGGGASVAAGPVGRNVSAETDYRLRAEIYSYSKTKGIFAGIDVSGTKWELDYAANRSVYASAARLPKGDDAKSVAALLTTGGAAAPTIVRPFLESLAKNIGTGAAR
ncbi:MAG TPA: lipid-binding SYLF domain-containing protein [Gemmatimonadaceae bacterium]